MWMSSYVLRCQIINISNYLYLIHSRVLDFLDDCNCWLELSRITNGTDSACRREHLCEEFGGRHRRREAPVAIHCLRRDHERACDEGHARPFSRFRLRVLLESRWSQQRHQRDEWYFIFLLSSKRLVYEGCNILSMRNAGKMIAGKPIYVALAQLKIDRQAQLVLFSLFSLFCSRRLLLPHLNMNVFIILEG